MHLNVSIFRGRGIFWTFHHSSLFGERVDEEERKRESEREKKRVALSALCVCAWCFCSFFRFISMSSVQENDGNDDDDKPKRREEGRRRQNHDDEHHPLYHGTNLTPKALIFDCDGTILETMTLFFVADKQTCEEVGLELTKKRFYELAGIFQIVLKLSGSCLCRNIFWP